MKVKSVGISENVLGYLMVTPTILCILVITLFPIIRTFNISLMDMRMQNIALASYVGLDNYIQLYSEPRFWSALFNTSFFTFWSVMFELVLGLGLAMLMNMTFKGRGILRASILVPWAIPTTVCAMMWKFIYHDQFGLLNDILVKLGMIKEYVAWLGSKSSAMWCTIFADVWKTTPFMALLLLAGLQTISSDLYEAAEVDGAGKIVKFFKITLPLVTPTILVALIFRTLDAFRVFDLIYVLTGGGPGNSTETVSVFAYKTLFQNLDFGMGSAISVSIFICTFIISQVYALALRKKS